VKAVQEAKMRYVFILSLTIAFIFVLQVSSTR